MRFCIGQPLVLHGYIDDNRQNTVSPRLYIMKTLLSCLSLFIGVVALLLVPSSAQAAPPVQGAGQEPQITFVALGLGVIPSGQTFSEGRVPLIQIEVTSADGITALEYTVGNGKAVPSNLHGARPTRIKSLPIVGISGRGTFSIRARVTTGRNLVGQATLTVYVTAGSNPVTPPPTGTCVNSAQFTPGSSNPYRSDRQPGESFWSTWDMTNTGTCTWTTAYSVSRVAGYELGTSVVMPIWSNPAGQQIRPGNHTLVSLYMTAPQSPQWYTSAWQLRAPDGAVFGPQLANQTQVRSCFGAPSIIGLKAVPSRIASNESAVISWNAILNADSLTLTTPNGNSDRALTDKSVTVTPHMTSNYTLTARCGAIPSSNTVQVAVSNPQPTTPPHSNQVVMAPVNVGTNSITADVTYYYNNQNAPAEIELIVSWRNGTQRSTQSLPASPNNQHTERMTVYYPSVQDDQIFFACLRDRTTVEVVCSQPPVPILK